VKIYSRVGILKSGKLLIILMQISVGGIVLIFPAILIYLYVFVFYTGDDLKMFPAQIPESTVSCELKSKTGTPGKSLMRTASGFRYVIKTPSNYSTKTQWPVLVVFSPTMGGGFMEAYTGLTGLLTEAGFIVTYVDSVPMNINLIPKLTEVIDAVNQQWCVDADKIFVAGHSDGGTIAQSLNFLSDIKFKSEIQLAGFVSSAAGLQKTDLQEYVCPVHATQAMVLHNTGDKHFENFGRGAAQWWAQCNSCDEKPIEAEKGCVVYMNCRKGASVKFCEQPGNHFKWPERRKEIVEFLKLQS